VLGLSEDATLRLVDTLKTECICCLEHDVYNDIWVNAMKNHTLLKRLVNDCYFCVQTAFRRCVKDNNEQLFNELMTHHSPALHVLVEAIAYQRNTMIQTVFQRLRTNKGLRARYEEEMYWLICNFVVLSDEEDESECEGNDGVHKQQPCAIKMIRDVLNKKQEYYFGGNHKNGVKTITNTARRMLKQVKFLDKICCANMDGNNGLLKLCTSTKN
jgi:hypothetical protein